MTSRTTVFVRCSRGFSSARAVRPLVRPQSPAHSPERRTRRCCPCGDTDSPQTVRAHSKEHDRQFQRSIETRERTRLPPYCEECLSRLPLVSGQLACGGNNVCYKHRRIVSELGSSPFSFYHIATVNVECQFLQLGQRGERNAVSSV